MSVLLMSDTDHELVHYETQPKIQMEKIPEKGQRKYRFFKKNPNENWKISQ